MMAKFSGAPKKMSRLIKQPLCARLPISLYLLSLALGELGEPLFVAHEHRHEDGAETQGIAGHTRL